MYCALALITRSTRSSEILIDSSSEATGILEDKHVICGFLEMLRGSDVEVWKTSMDM